MIYIIDTWWQRKRPHGCLERKEWQLRTQEARHWSTRKTGKHQQLFLHFKLLFLPIFCGGSGYNVVIPLSCHQSPGANPIKSFAAYPSEAPKNAPLQGRPLGLPANIRLGWKGLPGTSTSLLLKSVNYAVKRFIGLAPDKFTPILFNACS